MKLQILVPQYKETDEIIKPLLDSIMVQQSVDFSDIGVIIVNDGTDIKLSKELLNSYPYKIEYYDAPHRGVSATRNTCLDYANADYVMFCDADDMFLNACGLYLVFREMKTGFDTLTTKFIEEVHKPDDNTVVYINRENDCTFVHGKVHRRQYLIDNDIRWNPDLTIHEDSYFNVQCQSYTNEPKYLNESIYLWKWREDSVCRKDPQYILKTLPQLVDSIDSLIDKFEKTNKHDKAIYYTAYLLFDIFYSMNKPEWRQKENLEFVNKLEYRCHQFFNKHKSKWMENSLGQVTKISQLLRTKMVSEGMLLENMTIQQWLNKIDNDYKNIS